MVAAEMLKEKKTRAGARATQEGARADHPDSEGLGCAWTAAGPGGERKPNGLTGAGCGWDVKGRETGKQWEKAVGGSEAQSRGGRG
jgi:hypothetical protein